MEPNNANGVFQQPIGSGFTATSTASALLKGIGGVYCEDADIAALCPCQGMSAGVKPYSLDAADAKRLWRWTEELTGITFDLRG